jgi:AAA family ATP:ADP antiporter
LGSLSGVFAGRLSYYVSSFDYAAQFTSGYENWTLSFMLLSVIVCVCGLAIMALFFWSARQSSELSSTASKVGKKREKMNFTQSVKELLDSKYLLSIALLVLGYNITINLVEILWKSQVKLLYPTPEAFNAYSGNITFLVGVISTIAALLMRIFSKHLSWRMMALTTPVVLAVTAALFYGSFLGADLLEGPLVSALGLPMPVIVVSTGSLLIILARSAKYSVFDTSKEMAFIPLSFDERLRGKSAIDGVGSRLGKSGASLAQQGLFLVTGSAAASAPYTAGILFLVLPLFFGAARYLSKRVESQDALQVSTAPATDCSQPAAPHVSSGPLPHKSP